MQIKHVGTWTDLPSFVYVCRRRPLDGGPILVDLLIQWQRQWSVSYRQPQHQSLLGNRNGLITGPAHVLLGVVKALDRLVEGIVEVKQRFTFYFYNLVLIWSADILQPDLIKKSPGGLWPKKSCWTDATWCIKTSSSFQHIKHMQGQQKGITWYAFSPQYITVFLPTYHRLIR